MKLFIVGTDTEIGKTTIACGLLRVFNQAGYQTVGLKPVASGCEWRSGMLVNEDALRLQEAASIKLPYAHVNPIAFRDPIAVNIAASRQGTHLTVPALVEACANGFNTKADLTLVEGAGGWLHPINHTDTLADFALALQLPIVLVVGIRLGCLNHTLLTYRSIQQSGLNLLGWIGNCIDANMLAVQENIDTVTNIIEAPCFGIVGFKQQPEDALQAILEVGAINAEGV